MRIMAINGSPRGKGGNTDVLVQSFLDGAVNAGADTETVYLSEKRIEHCKGCHSCWTATPGQCVIKDDMSSILRQMGVPAFIVLASPVYLANVTGTLKDFIDRLTVTGNPHTARDITRDGQSSSDGRPTPPQFILASSCGFPGNGQFDVVSLWIQRLATMMGTRVAAEILTSQGKALRMPTEAQATGVKEFLSSVTAAGRALALGKSLSAPDLQRLQTGIAST
jgi:FMN-dependent NADH-azoreductase